jgi:YfiH family protein
VFFEKKDNLFIGRFSVWYGSSGLIHGFSTRKGGVSAAPYDSLNLGLNSDDDPAAVTENYVRFCGAAGILRKRIAFTKQVHGDRVLNVQKPDVYADTDALITDVPGLLLTIQVADCVPVFYYDPVRKAAGLAHAGWRGSALGIVAKTVRAMSESFGSRPEDVRACIGPSVGPCCYTVGPEVAGRFPAEYLNGNKLDLWRFNYKSLISAGIQDEHVQANRLCTACHSDRFFSHRADGGMTGRMLGIIGMNYPAASSGVSQGTEIMDAASGGELDWSPVSGDLSPMNLDPRPV